MYRRKTLNKKADDVQLLFSNWFSQLVCMLQTTFLFLIAGRGTSKSEEILAERTMDMSYDMPGAYIAVSADTFMNATKNIVPSIINGWNRKSWIEDVHYVIDKRPPEHFKKPYKPVLNWKNTITAFTGTHFKIISQDRPSIGAGDSFQHHIGDEAKYLNKKKLDKVNPAVRGEFVRFGKSPFYGGGTFVTDMPDENQGDHDWILKMSDNMDVKKIKKLYEVCVVVNELRIEKVNASHAVKADPMDTGAKRKLKLVEKNLERWEERLRKFRMGTTFFYVASSLVNIDILTTGYIKKLLETMDFREFMTSILSIEPKLETGQMFYPNLGNNNFFSDGFTYSRRDAYKLTDDYVESSLDLKYILHNEHLEAGLDTGNMCGLVVGQEQGKYYRDLKEFYTLPPQFLPELGEQFREYFKYHKRKELHLYHDRAANKWKSVGEDHASKIKKAIEYKTDGTASGWTVTLMNENQGNITQQEEYELMLELLSGNHPGLPKNITDRHNCPCLKSSMEGAKKIIKVDKQGNKTIHKDKSSEKLPAKKLPMKSTNMSDAKKYLMCRPAYLEKISGERPRFSGVPGSH